MHNRECDNIDLLRIAAVSPWNNITPATTPMEFSRFKEQLEIFQEIKTQHIPAPPNDLRNLPYGSLRPVKNKHGGDLSRPVIPTDSAMPLRPQHFAPSRASKIAHTGRGRADRLNAKPVVHAYKNLLKQTEATKSELAESADKWRMDDAAYRMGLANISDAMLAKQKDLIRYYAFKSEVDTFQQHLVPFILDIRSEHERQVHSSVYRHFNRMKAIQDMGIPIYNLGCYLLENTDRVVTARASKSLSRQLRPARTPIDGKSKMK